MANRFSCQSSLNHIPVVAGICDLSPRQPVEVFQRLVTRRALYRHAETLRWPMSHTGPVLSIMSLEIVKEQPSAYCVVVRGWQAFIVS